MDINRATALTEDVADTIDDMFDYHPWGPQQVQAGERVRKALADAVGIIITHVPPGPDRSVAIRKLRDARADCNSAITHGGKY